jgi:hypothetical protein
VFLVFHPAWASYYPAILGSLGINVVIFLAPALPFLGVMTTRGSLPGSALLWAMLISLAVFIGVLGFFHLTGWPLTANGAWNGTWAAANILLLVGSACGLVKPWSISFAHGTSRLFGLLFVASYGFYLYGAIAVVPEQEDHDLEVQGTGYGLLTRFEPLLLTDRDTLYYFAHPPLLHYYVAASFLYYGDSDQLKYYDDATQRVLAAERGTPFDPPPFGFIRVGQNEYVRHQITGFQNKRYMISPPLSDGSDRVLVRALELDSIYEHYTKRPHKLESRTPNIFLASLTVALLGCWVAKLTGQSWVGFLIALAYATSPEVFVRSSYGGYFAIGSFALLLMLLATVDRDASNNDGQNLFGFAAGCFAAWSDHKLVLFPFAIVLWQTLRTRNQWNRNLVKAALQPVVIGFAAGTLLFWIYGLMVNAATFWLEHVRIHLLDRILHYNPRNPLGSLRYPSVSGLWIEFWQHTGYLPLPLGLLSIYLVLVSPDERNTRGSSLYGIAGLWGVYVLINAIVFSWADWRMTKHLMLLMPVLYLAPSLWAAGYPKRLVLAAVIFLVLLTWNIYTVHEIVKNFLAFRISPSW